MIQLVEWIFQFANIALLVRVVLSWIPHNRFHPLIDLIYRLTEPMLRPFQDIVPAYKLGIDLSPLFAFFALSIIKRIVMALFFGLPLI